MKFLFSKKSKKIEILQAKVGELNRQLYYNRKDDINDFISILEQIQKTINTPMQWKQKVCTMNNEVNLALENYRNKIIELDINA